MWKHIYKFSRFCFWCIHVEKGALPLISEHKLIQLFGKNIIGYNTLGFPRILNLSKVNVRIWIHLNKPRTPRAYEQTDLGGIKLLLQSLFQSHQASVVGGCMSTLLADVRSEKQNILPSPSVNPLPHASYCSVCAVWPNYKIGHVLCQEMRYC